MAQFEAVINLATKVDKALRDLERVERQVNKLKDTTLDIKIKTDAIKKVEQSANNLTRSFRTASKAAQNLTAFTKAFAQAFIQGPAEELARALQAANKESEILLSNTAGYVRILKEAAKEQKAVTELARRNKVASAATANTLQSVESRLSKARAAQDRLTQGSEAQEKVAITINRLEETRNEIYKRREAQLRRIRSYQESIRDTVERNVRASRAARSDSGFASFSQQAGNAPQRRALQAFDNSKELVDNYVDALDNIRNVANRNNKAVAEAQAKRVNNLAELRADKENEIFKLRDKLNKRDEADFDRRLKARVEARKKAENDVAAQRKRGADRLESLALGVGFPLLFGGGAGSIIGGAAGSFIGNGFGGQIIASAVGQQLDAFIGKVAELGQALNPATADLDTLVQALGITGTETEKYIKELENLEQTEQALTAATVELAAVVGRDGVDALREFGQDTTKLGNEFSRAMLIMQTALAQFINQSGILKAVVDRIEFTNLVNQAENSDDPRIALLRTQRANANPTEAGEINQQIADLQRTINQERENGLKLSQQEKAVNEAKLADLIAQRNLTVAENELLASGLDLTTDTGYALAEKVVEAQYYTQLQSIINSNLDTESQKIAIQIAQLERKNELQELENKRDQQITRNQEAAARAARTAARAAGTAARSAETAAKEEARIQSNLAGLRTKEYELETQLAKIGKDQLEQTRIELARLNELTNLKQQQITLSTEDERIRKAQLSNADKEQLILRENLLLQQRTLRIQKEIEAIEGRQETAGLRRQLQQELGSSALPTGNPFTDERTALAVEQANRQANALADINNQLEIQKKLLSDPTQADDARRRIEQLKEVESVYRDMLPEIFAAEQAQLAFNQALSQVQGPVNSLVSGFREVVAGTKSVEQAFADFLNTIADQLAQTAAQMIAQYIALGIARAFATGSSPNVPNFSQGVNNPLGVANPSDFNLDAFAGFFANGGTIPSGQFGVVGENGPEFVSGPAKVTPMGAGTVVNITVNSNGTTNQSASGKDAEEAAQLGRLIERSTLAIINREKRPGGTLAR